MLTGSHETVPRSRARVSEAKSIAQVGEYGNGKMIEIDKSSKQDALLG